jgi:hypothetical protein
MEYRYDPDVQSASIVLVGRFNPAIVSPGWLLKVGVMSEGEFETSNIVIIHPEITQFSIERFRIEVLPQRFTITTAGEPYVQILDDVVVIFTQLPHSPIKMFGVNLEIHFKLHAAEQRVALGRALAPVAPWGEFGKRLESKHLDDVGGMVTLTMQENRPATDDPGYRQVKIERSSLVRSNSAVMMNINNHFELRNTRDEDGAHPALALLQQRFDASIVDAKKIVFDMMEFASTLKW